MSGYTRFCQRATCAGWATVPKVATSLKKWYEEQRKRRQSRGVVSKAGNGCAAWIFLGPLVMTFLYIAIPVTIGLGAVVYAGFWSLLYGIGLGVDQAVGSLRRGHKTGP
jgi:hypothetical protein